MYYYLKVIKLNRNNPKVAEAIADTLAQQDAILRLKNVSSETLNQIITI